MSFAIWSIRNPIPSILFFIFVTVAGIRAFSLLPVQDLPDLSLPMVSVVATLPGASPAQLETDIARPLEDALSSLEGLRHTTTTISDGTVTIEAVFELQKLLSDALVQTKDAVDGARSELPDEMLEPTASPGAFSAAPVVAFAVASRMRDDEQLSWLIDDALSKALRAVPGVGRVERFGGVQREVRVAVDPVRMAGLGVTAQDISGALQSAQQQSSGGRATLGTNEQSIRTIAIVGTAADLVSLPIVLADGRRIRLDQVARVQDSVAERTQIAYLDGKPTMGFQVFRSRGTGETRVADGVKAELDKFLSDHPDISLTNVGGSVEYTLEQYEGSMAMLYEGGLLAIVVVFLFLRDWRATLIAAAALPLSILPTLAVMHVLGFSLNTLTLLALAAVVGILVDDAIVEIENIERHRRTAPTVIQATEKAVSEIAKAVIATTFSLIAVFLPTAMMSGYAGVIFQSFGWTAVIAVFASLLVARLLTPMMAAYLLKGDVRQERKDRVLTRRYLSLVRICLDHPKLTIAATAAFLAASISLVRFLPTDFLPPDDRSQTEVAIELPPGSPIESTLEVANHASAALRSIDGVRSILVLAGQGGDAGSADVRNASLTLLLDEAGDRPSKSEIEAMVQRRLESVAGARFSIGQGGTSNLELILASNDPNALRETAREVERDMRTVAGLSNVTSTETLNRPEVVIRPDFERAAERGVTAQEIGSVLRIATAGDFDGEVARLNLDSRQINIRTRLADDARGDLDTIRNLRVAGRDGLVPLASIASISLEDGPAQIDRYDRQRFVRIKADLNGMAQGAAMASIDALPSVRNLPPTVSIIPDGGAEIGEELAGGFITALLTGVLCIFCVLVLLFRDFFQPVTILSALPLSIGGAFVGLLVMGSTLSMPAMIGMVMLMGIVAKNSILLVEYGILGMQERGLSRVEAIIDACHKRARPIIMTTVAMIAGMLPILLGLSADSSFRQPMAACLIGGLLTSTVLSLVVVPVIFTLIDRAEHDLRAYFRRRGAAPQESVGNLHRI